MRRIYDALTVIRDGSQSARGATGYDAGIAIQALPWDHWNTTEYDETVLVIFDVTTNTGGAGVKAEVRVDTDTDVSNGKLIGSCDINGTGRHPVAVSFALVKQLLGSQPNTQTYIGSGVVITGGTAPSVQYKTYFASPKCY